MTANWRVAIPLVWVVISHLLSFWILIKSRSWARGARQPLPEGTAG